MSKQKFCASCKAIIAGIIIFAGLGFSLTQLAQPAGAVESNANTILKKTLLNGLRECYVRGAFEQSVNGAEYTDKGIEAVLVERDDIKIFVPNTPVGFGFGVAKQISCKNIFKPNGGQKFDIASVTGKGSKPSLEDLGYFQSKNISGNSDDRQCVSYQYHDKGSTKQTNQICFTMNNGVVRATTANNVSADLRRSGVGLEFIEVESSIKPIYDDQAVYNVVPLYFSNINGKSLTEVTSFLSQWGSGLSDATIIGSWDEDEKIGVTNITLKLSDIEEGANGQYALRDNTGLAALKYYTDGEVSSWSSVSLKYTQMDAYTLYMGYLNEAISHKGYVSIGSCGQNKPSSGKYGYYSNGQWCEIVISPEGPENPNYGNTYTVINGSRNGLIEGDIEYIASALTNIPYLTLENEGETFDSHITGSTTNSSTGEEISTGGEMTACFEGAGVLGWVLCPVLEAAGSATQAMYNFIESSLQVNNNLVNSSGIRSGWDIFRNFANIIFAILFIIVILSQLTGIGLSNYNIKTILPRLIMVVILTNISFILCQLAVDVSNILGSGLNEMFKGFASQAAEEAGGDPFDLGTVIGGLVGTTASIGGAIALTVVGFSITIPFGLWKFPIFLAVISAVISILFFFVILGVRQAGIVILITLAPVAIVCYALPNTKPFFDRWKKMLTALLLVYPICGALMGGGQFASTVLLMAAHDGDAGVSATIVAMLVQVVPFLFIPSILKNSLAAMGNLGMKLANFGSRFSNGLTNGIRNSQIGRNIQRQAQMDYDLKAWKKLENKKKLPPGARRRMNRYKASYMRSVYEDARAGVYDSVRDLPEAVRDNPSIVGAMNQHTNENISNYGRTITNGQMDSIRTNSDGTPVGKLKGNDSKELGRELDAYYEMLMDPNLSNSDRTAYTEKAMAIMSILMDKGTNGDRKKIINALGKTFGGKQDAADLVDNNAEVKDSFDRLGAYIKDTGAIKKYKEEDPGNAKLVGDWAAGNYQKLTGLDIINSDDDYGLDDYYDRSVTGGTNIDDMSKTKPSYYQNLSHAFDTGKFTGRHAANFATQMSDSENSTKPPEANTIEAMNKLQNKLYASDRGVEDSSRTLGAIAIGNSHGKALEPIIERFKEIDWNAVMGDNAKKTEYQNLIANIQDSLRNDRHSTEDVSILQQALRSARNGGFVGADGRSIEIVRPGNDAGINVRQEIANSTNNTQNASSNQSGEVGNVQVRQDGSTMGQVGPINMNGGRIGDNGILVAPAPPPNRRERSRDNDSEIPPVPI